MREIVAYKTILVMLTSEDLTDVKVVSLESAISETQLVCQLL